MSEKEIWYTQRTTFLSMPFSWLEIEASRKWHQNCPQFTIHLRDWDFWHYIKANKRIFVRPDMNLIWLTTLYNTTSRFKERSSQQFLPYSDPDRDLFLPRNQNTTIHLFAHLLLCMENCNCCRLQTLIPFGQCCNQKNRAARKCSMLFRGQPIKGPP